MSAIRWRIDFGKGMTRAFEPLQPVTEHEVYQFAGPVIICDPKAFAQKLQAFVQTRVEAVNQVAKQEAAQGLVRQAERLRTERRWTPGATQVQRGRAIMMDAFNQPTNLAVQQFAALAGKSRQQIYKDIDARLLLALNVEPRGQKLPDWQLDEVQRRLTQTVLAAAYDLDNWTIYRALSQPYEGLGGRAPVDAVTADSIAQTARAVVDALGLQAQ